VNPAFHTVAGSAETPLRQVNEPHHAIGKVALNIDLRASMTTIRTSSRKPRHARALEMAAAMTPTIDNPEPSHHDFGEALALETPTDRVLHAALARLSGGFSPMGIAEAWFDWAVHLGASPGRMAEIAQAGLTEAAHVAELTMQTASGRGVCDPCARSLPHDKRFRHESWRQWPFAIYAESFLSMERWWDEATRGVHGATKHHLDLLHFVGRQALDMVAPSNFPMTNPEVIKRTVDAKGNNILLGAQYLFDDLQRTLHHQKPAGAEAFEPGKTVALTPGDVVLRTHLVEVIQYHPTTDKVRAEPILIVPAWIMKYYILDLRPQNSLIKHLVDEGFTVFVLSRRNPSAADHDVGFDDYRSGGVMPAIETALARTGASRLHAVGYCIGGTLLAVTAAAMARDGDDRLQSLTFLAAQTDFTEAGELKTFVDESQLAILDDMMWEQGALEASQMAGTFHLLRSNDLIWSRLIRHYLLGVREKMTDVAAWSADATRMPGRMHSEYLRAFYLKNDLAEGRFVVDGETVSLQDIHVPTFAVGTEWDHVAPWRSVYKLHRLTGSPITFALTNGGHNQGIVSPPGREDRHFRIATSAADDSHIDPDHWFRNAEYHEGSWWPAWFEWLGAHAGRFVDPPARKFATDSAELGPAPGTYVHG
jgi:polyhydroxyalkanoate synthase subunit PhaC